MSVLAVFASVRFVELVPVPLLSPALLNGFEAATEIGASVV